LKRELAGASAAQHAAFPRLRRRGPIEAIPVL